MKILSLFSSVGIGETLLHNKPGLEFTGVEIIPKLATEYKNRFPKDKVIIEDAYNFLYDNYQYFDIIIASPPCQSYSRLSKMNRIEHLENSVYACSYCRFIQEWEAEHHS